MFCRNLPGGGGECQLVGRMRVCVVTVADFGLGGAMLYCLGLVDSRWGCREVSERRDEVERGARLATRVDRVSILIVWLAVAGKFR